MFCVRVPVLSEHITLHEPKVSTAGNRLTIAFLLLIFPTPMARTIVTTVARPSGIAATAKAIAVLKQSTQALERSAPNLICSIISKIKTIAQMTKAISPITLPTAESLCCKGVVASS